MYRRIASQAGPAGERVLAKLMNRDQARNQPPWLPANVGALAIGADAIAPETIPLLFQAASESDLPPREAFNALAHIPTLILGWSGDALHPVSSAQELHRLLPASELHIADDYAGFKAFPATIRSFIERIAQT